jgi:hypothetical protein
MDDETTREHSRGEALSRSTELAAGRDRAPRPAHARLSAAALARIEAAAAETVSLIAAVAEGMLALVLAGGPPRQQGPGGDATGARPSAAGLPVTMRGAGGRPVPRAAAPRAEVDRPGTRPREMAATRTSTAIRSGCCAVTTSRDGAVKRCRQQHHSSGARAECAARAASTAAPGAQPVTG